jgi:5-formyltetrahydrofolate cyclo-ligase
MSYPNEADTKTIFADLLSRGVTVAIPRAENGKLVLRRVMSIKDFTRGSYGILEPRKSCAVISADQVDLFIVPGIAFDKDGYRLGRGKGYYDKLLTGVHADIIGLAFDIQVVAEVPHFSYDVPMTAVVTESYVYENKTS